jgi:hypothetical protein
MGNWSQGYRERVAEHIAFYKSNLRFYSAEAYSVISQWKECEIGASTTPGCEDSWDSVEFVDPVEQEALVYVFRNRHADTSRNVVLRGLNPTADYQVYVGLDETAEGEPATGEFFMTNGAPVDLQKWSSEILLIKHAEP